MTQVYNKTADALAKKQLENAARRSEGSLGRKNSGILLYVRTWAGDVLTLNLGDSLHYVTVGEVKQRLNVETDLQIPVEDQVLFFQGKEMNDDSTVISHGWLVFILCVHLLRKDSSLDSSLNSSATKFNDDMKNVNDFVEEVKKHNYIESGYCSSANASTVASRTATKRLASKNLNNSGTTGVVNHMASLSSETTRYTSGGLNSSGRSSVTSANLNGYETQESQIFDENEFPIAEDVSPNNLEEDFHALNTENLARISEEAISSRDISHATKRTASSGNGENANTNGLVEKTQSRRGSSRKSSLSSQRKQSKEYLIVSASDIMSKVNSLNGRTNSEHSSNQSQDDFLRNFQQAYSTAWENAHSEGVHAKENENSNCGGEKKVMVNNFVENSSSAAEEPETELSPGADYLDCENNFPDQEVTMLPPPPPAHDSSKFETGEKEEEEPTHLAFLRTVSQKLTAQMNVW